MRRSRAYRRHHRSRVIANRIEFLRVHDPDRAPGGNWEVDPGSWAKRHPFDCGGPCLLCHWDKFMEPKRRSQKERDAIDDQLDGMRVVENPAPLIDPD